MLKDRISLLRVSGRSVTSDAVESAVCIFPALDMLLSGITFPMLKKKKEKKEKKLTYHVGLLPWHPMLWPAQVEGHRSRSTR
jgi:hypothetical protein